ncbi:MAG: 16S rRNA (adenine(1518)-N(6)/adenine(1519)-N(6))-dimethyltransferase RsmA [Rickettsiales bacterium]|nr:16S rRNA (adenine(1518)-N(6)/adenine(1519)-N(6))-dimethyltransferase RsmA [Rickettsiales bacterium]MCA0253932.1 16S rRNA (adenine(1518)-N(6)/adenine(1519)-N(6))-dimethyltransferase RsmA [Pseudomonadota bacterium]
MLDSIAKLAAKHGIVPVKRFGQNFIYDDSLCDKIVRFSEITSKSTVLEIGPGPAGLSRSILKISPKRLTVIEMDARCLPLLNEIKEYYPVLEVINKDALKVKLSEVSKEDKIDIISNLPYNVGTQLLTDWLSQLGIIKSMTLMLQKEVVDRITATKNSKAYGRLSVFVQIFCHASRCFDVSPKVFYPQPKVWSSVVRLVPRDIVPDSQIVKNLEHITRFAFSGRRKMIKSSLSGLAGNIVELLSKLDIDPSCRAENISSEEYLRLARELKML